ADDVERAAAALRDGARPVIVAGGGAILAEAWAEVLALAERLGAPVVTASTCGNALASSADVILSIGNRFTDWSASSYRKGVTFAIPPSRLIQIDIDPREIGKNYPVDVALVGHAKAAAAD